MINYPSSSFLLSSSSSLSPTGFCIIRVRLSAQRGLGFKEVEIQARQGFPKLLKARIQGKFFSSLILYNFIGIEME